VSRISREMGGDSEERCVSFWIGRGFSRGTREGGKGCVRQSLTHSDLLDGDVEYMVWKRASI